MKNIHPQYNVKAAVKCACGNTFETGSTSEAILTELCNKCHPFYTGTQKILDSARRVEKFQTRIGKKAGEVRSKKDKEAKRRAEREEKKKAEMEPEKK
ncbi:50S ribosomal protein L31 [Candidatus Uhrbacteria bacterium]|jgi:large subunit ribosomal protein L31|nr:50S ribosomal protein L31 [Candidatus Uhrbacteria bacterium]